MKSIIGIFLSTLLLADVVPLDKAYFSKKVRNTELIYTEKNIPFATQVAKLEMALQPLYEETFGYVMDEPLHVGLISEYNQIANGFSTQYPNNRQINYIGGAMMVDYFSAVSWLDTLLYHETAHNYQMNVKDNVISSSLHHVIRNGAFFIPWFTIPNIVESSFMAEGNAVMNESWHGNGGRLYSGRFKAATMMQAKAGYLTPERVYNDNHYFLYNSHFYTLGGFYHYYLAEKYGIENVNAYWKSHSEDWYWPFFTNNAMQRAIGVDFETSFDAWRKVMEAEASNVIEPQGELIATTQFYSPINADSDEIYFMINESGRETPELLVYDKENGSVAKQSRSWIAGKVIKTGKDKYTTQASAYTSPWRIYQGLYNEDGFIVDQSESKVIEGYLSDGRPVYFDVPGSYDQPQLYTGNMFYAQSNSSVFIDEEDNLYYFVQNGKTRTLYKNGTAIFSLQGYYGYVSGVDSKGAIYFIANTPHGSGLFKYNNGQFKRTSHADTIFDARLIDDETAIVAAMGSDAYLYRKIALDEIDEAPFEVTLFVEDQPYCRAAEATDHHAEMPQIDTEEPYYSLLAMNYSGTNIAMGNDSDAGFIFNAAVNFADPLMQNVFSLFALRNTDEYTLAGAGYTNTQYFLQYTVSGYGVLDRPDSNETVDKDDERDFGLIVNAQIPFIRAGHYSAALTGSYYQDYESNSREPLSLSLDLMRAEQYGVSMYPDLLLSLVPYASRDRGDMAYGGKAAYAQGLGREWYLALAGQYSKSDAQDFVDSRGIKLTKSAYEQYADSDPTTISMPSIKSTGYVKSTIKGSVSLKTVINLSSYFFTFPISLRRESLYATYNRYALETFSQPDEYIDVNEAVAGLVLDTLWMNKMPIPVVMEYIYNDNEDIAQEHSFRVRFGIAF